MCGVCVCVRRVCLWRVCVYVCVCVCVACVVVGASGIHREIEIEACAGVAKGTAVDRR